ncbi:alpha/beta hydrolase [Chitinophaga silvatica]|uniref:Alpha/beta hydrolase n=1 Tax=Chitinophaga silvatica TaxID=2282649 RepID=A0A3E1Y4I7_9BACT|nr:alpha/beta hydrolase [Chitinophaga silvatica]RFS19556.1 alpha/beta hydrolase [Chitinophaga silvatica]
MRKALKIVTFILGVCILAGLAIYVWMSFSQEKYSVNDQLRSQAPGEFIALKDGLVHYKISGTDSSHTIVFIHGGGATGMEVWDYTLPSMLEGSPRILTYDLYGRGYSDRPDVDYSAELYEQQLKQLLDTLGFKQPVDLVAMSMGSAIAMQFTARHPERVRKLVLLGPAASGDLRASKLLSVPVLDKFLMTCYWYPRSIENQRKEFRDMELFAKYSQRLQHFIDFEGYKRITLSTWHCMLNKSQLHFLSAIQPNSILLIYGDSDPFFPIQKLEDYKKLYPTLISKKITNAGHMPHYEQPDQVNPLIKDFLKLD